MPIFEVLCLFCNESFDPKTEKRSIVSKKKAICLDCQDKIIKLIKRNQSWNKKNGKQRD
tara:strand:- start:12 stop:188 length:177 start_codon:yes stop_codon:yes gene_type:complete